MRAARSLKDERIEVRLSRAVKRELARAARLVHQTVSEFVISSARAQASQVLREREIFKLTRDESERFVAALLKAPEPTPEFVKAAEKYRTAVAEGRVISR